MVSAWPGRIFGSGAVVLLVAAWVTAGGARAAELNGASRGLPFAVADGLAAVEQPNRSPVGAVADQMSTPFRPRMR